MTPDPITGSSLPASALRTRAWKAGLLVLIAAGAPAFAGDLVPSKDCAAGKCAQLRVDESFSVSRQVLSGIPVEQAEWPAPAAPVMAPTPAAPPAPSAGNATLWLVGFLAIVGGMLLQFFVQAAVTRRRKPAVVTAPQAAPAAKKEAVVQAPAPVVVESPVVVEAVAEAPATETVAAVDAPEPVEVAPESPALVAEPAEAVVEATVNESVEPFEAVAIEPAPVEVAAAEPAPAEVVAPEAAPMAEETPAEAVPELAVASEAISIPEIAVPQIETPAGVVAEPLALASPEPEAEPAIEPELILVASPEPVAEAATELPAAQPEPPRQAPTPREEQTVELLRRLSIQRSRTTDERHATIFKLIAQGQFVRAERVLLELEDADDSMIPSWSVTTAEHIALRRERELQDKLDGLRQRVTSEPGLRRLAVAGAHLRRCRLDEAAGALEELEDEVVGG